MPDWGILADNTRARRRSTPPTRVNTRQHAQHAVNTPPLCKQRRIKRLFTTWRVSHTERKEAGEDDPEEDETKVEIPPSAVTIYPKGTPVPTPDR